MNKSTTKLGKLQLDIMRVLWREGSATARRITEVLNGSEPVEQGDPPPRLPVAHSTVQTLLRKLEVKGTVTHDVVDRIFVFRPLVPESDVAETATRDLLSRIFGGSVSGLVAHLLRHETVSDDELQALRRMIDEGQTR